VLGLVLVLRVTRRDRVGLLEDRRAPVEAVCSARAGVSDCTECAIFRIYHHSVVGLIACHLVIAARAVRGRTDDR
jgi:N-acetylmuramic acid 6-phosphate (MurNAc-6-P) etherase